MSNKTHALISYELKDDIVTLKHCYYSARFSVNSIKQLLPEAVINDKLDYHHAMNILSKSNWKRDVLSMVTTINNNKIELFNNSPEAYLSTLETSINGFLDPLFDKKDAYYEYLLDIVSEITDNREFVMRNGKKYKIKLVEV